MSLTVQGVTKAFAGIQVLDGVSMAVEPGEIVCLMGPSGTGKTTLLRCLCGLEMPDAGTIEISGSALCRDGRRQPSAEAYRRKIGLVFQNWNLFPHWNIMNNLIEAPVRQKLMNRSEAEKKARELLGRLQIGDKERAYPDECSGGQKQRAAIARACMLAPEILCFDEPTSALDQASGQGVTAILQDLAQESLGLLIVTHDEVFARRTATRRIDLDALQSSSRIIG